MSDLKLFDEQSNGWQTHPGTFCGHYFRANEDKSWCNRVMRHTGAVETDATIKCTVCQTKISEAFTPSLLGEAE
jgi:hypothetical protein